MSSLAATCKRTALRPPPQLSRPRLDPPRRPLAPAGITRANQHVKDLAGGYVIRWDHEDEAPVAQALHSAVREALPSGPEFTVQDTGVRSSRWYLSVFLCPGWNA